MSFVPAAVLAAALSGVVPAHPAALSPEILAVDQDAKPVVRALDAAALRKEAFCLAEAVYREARGKSLAHQRAIATVVLNRVVAVRLGMQDDDAPPPAASPPGRRGPAPEAGRGAITAESVRGFGRPTVCGVLQAPGQFPWARGKGRRIGEPEAWETASKVAAEALSGKLPHMSGATHFVSGGKPGWAKGMRLVVKHDNHIFMARKDAPALLAALDAAAKAAAEAPPPPMAAAPAPEPLSVAPRARGAAPKGRETSAVPGVRFEVSEAARLR